MVPETQPTLSRDAQLEALARCELLAGLQRPDLEKLLDRAVLQVSLPREQITREDEPAGEMYFVLSGEVRLWRGDLPLRSLGPGGHFGDLSLVTGRPRSATAISEGRATLAVLQREGWERLSAERPALALQLLRALVAHLRDELVERTDTLSLLLRGRTQPRAREVTVSVLGRERRVPTGTPVRALLPREVDGELVVAGLLGQKPVSLVTPLCTDGPVAPLTTGHWEGRALYSRSAGLLLLEAANGVDPSLQLRLGPELAGTQQLLLPPGADAAALHPRLSAAARDLVDRDLPFRHELWALDEAIAWLSKEGWHDAARLLRSRREGTVSLVSCGKVYALSMGPMLPSTGLLHGLTLELHQGTLLLEAQPGPQAGRQRLLPGDGAMARAHEAWLLAMGIADVGSFNDSCVSGQVQQLVRVAEGFHEKQIGLCADAIAARGARVRVIAIAGPSSSGKTTFIKRLVVQLQVSGRRPKGLSLDDYYLDREKTPRDAKGDYDFESMDALDLPLLRAQVARLLAGEEVRTARFDFVAGRSHPEGGASLQLAGDDVLLLEGIHGLNPELLGPILGAGELFRVFLHPTTTLPFDRLSRVASSDVRLLRRIIRDRHHRGYSAADNILRWPSVLAGEERHIFPFRAQADVTFDSSLVYELAVLKVFAERYLLEVPQSHPAYGTAWRLRQLVDRFVTIYPDRVPPTSIIREFIGGSGFEY